MHALGYTSFNNSTGDLVLSVVLAFVFGYIGYRTSHRFRAIVGVTPWRIPSLVWAAICFVLLPLGVILEWVAEFTTRPEVATESDRRSGPGGGARSAGRTGALPDARRTPGPSLASVQSPAPPARWPSPRDHAGHNALFGWYADVTGRHELRYWDGKRWSEHVSDDGTVSSDPIEH